MDEKIFGSESGEVADDLEALAAIEREMGLMADAERHEARMKQNREKYGAVAGGGGAP